MICFRTIITAINTLTMKFIDDDLMERYLRGESDAEERHKVLMWLIINLKSSTADDDFVDLYQNLEVKNDPMRKQRVKSRISTLISVDQTQKKREKTSKRLIALFGSFLAVACVAILLLINTVSDMRRDLQTISTWTEVSTSYGEKKEVVLPDGSHIWLRNDSRISFPENFPSGIRQVFITGEIYADIISDESRPFIVTSDSVNVIVKGTEFNFRSYSDMSDVELTLIEGAVDMEYVYEQGCNSLSMTPGETVTIDLKNGKISQYVLNANEYVSWKDRRALYFNDKTLQEIVTELQREFEVRIEIKDKALARTRHFASFVNDESPIEILKALCSESDIEVEQKDSIIYIYNH